MNIDSLKSFVSFAPDVQNIIKRRLAFIHSELGSENPKYDQTISIALRALSNFATIGIDGGSFVVKQKNLRISESAKNLRAELNDDKKWASLTINEHPTPLKDLWASWKIEKSTLTIYKIWSDLVDHPMITITKTEDARLREQEKSGYIDSQDRYQKAGIIFNGDI